MSEGSEPMFPALYVKLAATPRAAKVGRMLVSHALPFWGLDDLEDTATLLMSELVTNAIKAPSAMAVPIVAPQVRIQDKSLFLEVWDGSPTMPTQRTVETDEEGGRGLPMVDLLTEQRWGAYRPHFAAGTRTEEPGKVVYAELAIDHAPEVSIIGQPLPLSSEIQREQVKASRGEFKMADAALLARICDPLAKR